MTTLTITGTAASTPTAADYYASASDVAALCRNLINNDSNFGSSTSPTLTQVNSWLSSGCAIIEAKISDMGYAVPITATTTVYKYLTDLNALYAAARAELSRINVTLGPGERTRGQVFDEMFWKQLKQLENLNLATMGASRYTSSDTVGIFGGGLTDTSKDTYTDNSDYVTARFTRGMLSFDSNSGESIDAASVG